MTNHIAALIEQAKADYPHRSQASTQLSVLGAAALPAIVEELRGGARKHRPLWQNILLDMAPREIVPTIVSLLNEREPSHVLVAAFRVAARSGDSRVLAPLCEAATQGWASFSSLDALGDLGDPDAIPVLRGVASELLGGVLDAGALAAVAARAAREDYVHDLRVLIRAATALAKLGDQEMSAVVVALSRFGRAPEEQASESYVVRLEAVASLRHVVGAGMVPALSAALRDTDPDVSDNAIEASLYLGIPDFVRDWIELLRSEDDARAGKAYRAIYGLTGQWPAAPPEEGRPDPDQVASWWESAQAEFDSRVCTRLGQPASPPLLFPSLGHSDTLQRARAELHAITGVDFAPAIMPYWGLDLNPIGRAEAWWQQEGGRFEAGGLYRFGRKYELAAARA